LGCEPSTGDWERVTVLVCKNQQRARRVVLSQHGWNQHLNCDAGECTLNGAQMVILAQLCNFPVDSLSMQFAVIALEDDHTPALPQCLSLCPAEALSSWL
jgi:hypothetical protein